MAFRGDVNHNLISQVNKGFKNAERRHMRRKAYC